jgi:hemerythrin-like domain-containing protein
MKLDNLFAKSAPTFDEPIEMLKACHERIASQCATLEKLVAHLPSHGSDVQAQQAAKNILRYFNVAGPHHHADEEQDLFPLLIEIGERLHSPLRERIAGLLDEHRTLEAAWAQLRVVLADIAEGKSVPLGEALVAGFVGAYRSHIAQEEREILPFAEAHLDLQQRARLSKTMVARRTVAPQ